MMVLSTILASPLAFDYLGTILLLLLFLTVLAGLGNVVNRMADWPHTPHNRHAFGHKLHGLISRRHTDFQSVDTACKSF